MPSCEPLWPAAAACWESRQFRKRAAATGGAEAGGRGGGEKVALSFLSVADGEEYAYLTYERIFNEMSG